MKKSIILIIVVILIGLSGYSQQKNDTTVSITKSLTAGDELIKYTKHTYMGYTLTFVGGGIMFLGSQLSPKYKLNPDPTKICYVIGGISTLIGAIFLLESSSHIKKAGLILNENGVGLVYNF